MFSIHAYLSTYTIDVDFCLRICFRLIYLSGLKSSGFKMDDCILLIKRTRYKTKVRFVTFDTIKCPSMLGGLPVFVTVSAHPSTCQASSRVVLRVCKSGYVHIWWTTFKSPNWLNQAPTGSQNWRRQSKPLRQCISHSSKFPGCTL